MNGRHTSPAVALDMADTTVADLLGQYPRRDVTDTATRVVRTLTGLSALRGRRMHTLAAAHAARLCAVLHGIRGRTRLDAGDLFGATQCVGQAHSLADPTDRPLAAFISLLEADVRLADDDPASALELAEHAALAAHGSRAEPLAAAYTVRALARLDTSTGHLGTLTQFSRVAAMVDEMDLPESGPVTLTGSTRAAVGAALLEALSCMPGTAGPALGLAQDVLPAADHGREYPGPARLSLAAALAATDPDRATVYAVQGLSECVRLGRPTAPVRARAARVVDGLADTARRRELADALASA